MNKMEDQGNNLPLSQVKHAALCLTHNCNLRCSYCYSGKKRAESMTAGTAARAIDFLAGQSNGSSVVTFFGGEPLIEFDLIRDIVRYTKENGYDIAFRMSTNGTLVTPGILSFFRENGIYFVLSIDGDEKQHDLSRRYVGGRGSYRDIEDKLGDILRFNPYTIAVSVITPETAGLVFDGARNLFAKGFRYVLQTLDYSAAWTPEDIETLRGQHTKLASFYYDALDSGRKIMYGPFDERIRTWAQKPYGRGDLCDLANSQVAIAPSGRIYPCVQFIGGDDGLFLENSIGDVFEGFDEGRRRSFVDLNYKEKESCRGCALLGRCANFCGCVNWRSTGRVDMVPPIICEYEKMLMPIVDRLANRLWKKRVPLFKRKFYEKTYPVSSYIEDCLIRKRSGNAEG